MLFLRAYCPPGAPPPEHRYRNQRPWCLAGARRAKTILRTEGLIPLVRRGFPFVLGRCFQYGTYYLYEYATEDVRKLNEADFMPKIDNFTLKIVSSNEEADRLEAEGLEFRSHDLDSRKWLDKRALAFCVFIGLELANIRWIAMTEKAKAAFPEPYRSIDLANSRALGHGNWTNPNYRRTGLSTYVYLKTLQFLLGKGKVARRGATAKGNIIAQKAYAKLAPRIYAEAHYLKILWWKWWKEKPLEQPNVHRE